jgi:hypothetical protein
VTDDYDNGKDQEGFGRGQYTIRNGYDRPLPPLISSLRATDQI